MADNSEYKLLNISIKKPAKYGSVLSKELTQRQTYINHNVQKDDTLQGIALKYNVSMEKIKRCNNLWTSDSLFLRSKLSIPVDKKKLNENSPENGSEYGLDEEFLDIFKNGVQENSSNQDELVQKSREESISEFLSRCDRYIQRSKNEAENICNSSKVINSLSENNIFSSLLVKNTHGQRQHSLHNNDVCFREITDKSLKNGRNVVYSLRQLEKEQDKIFEL